MMISAIALGICCFLQLTESADQLVANYHQSLKDVNDLLRTWEDLNAIKLPNGLVYRALPNNFVSVQDGHDYWYITKRNNKIVSPSHARAIYLGVKSIDNFLQPALDGLNVSCVHLRPTISDLKAYTRGKLSYIHSSSGEICGLSTLKNKKNMAVLNDDKSFISVAVSYTSREVHVKFKAMTVTDDEGAIFKRLPVNISVGLTSVVAYASFSVPKLLKALDLGEPKFVKIELKTTGFQGAVMEVDGINEQAVEALENTKLEDFIMEKVRNKVNSVLEKMASPISREIRRRKRRSQEQRRNMKRVKKDNKKKSPKKKENTWHRCLIFGCHKWN